MHVAQHEKTPLSILKQLAKDSELDVRASVATNKFTPKIVLKQLAKSRHNATRINVSLNSNTPFLTLLKLAFDANKTVRKSARLYCFIRYSKLLGILIFVGGISITIIARSYFPPLPVFLIVPLNFILLAIAAYKIISNNSR